MDDHWHVALDIGSERALETAFEALKYDDELDEHICTVPTMVRHILQSLYGNFSSLLRFQVSVQILIPLIFYFSQFIFLIFYCKHLQSVSVCCDSCDCTFSQQCDSVTSALFQRLRYEFMSSSLFLRVSYFFFRQSVR